MISQSKMESLKGTNLEAHVLANIPKKKNPLFILVRIFYELKGLCCATFKLILGKISINCWSTLILLLHTQGADAFITSLNT